MRIPSRLTGIALALAALPALPAWADITSSGAVYTHPTGNLPLGPGNTDLGNNALQVGTSGIGALGVAGGSLLRTAALAVGASGTGNGNGTVLLTGAGSRLELTGDGFSDSVLNRLGVGEWGYGSLTVADGALLDGRANASACLGVNHYCNNYIGNAAGSTGEFTITGAGSQASFLRSFVVGGVAVFHPPIDSFTFGTPGGTTQGLVKVLAGGTLTTDAGQIGSRPGGGSPTGTERSIADVLIDGPGSLWRVTGGTLETSGAGINLGGHKNAITSLSVTNGGAIRVEGPQGLYSFIQLANNGGRSDMLVAGTGSRVDFVSDAGVLQVGQSLGNASLIVRDGGQIGGLFYVAVGRTAAFGEMTIDGSGSLLRLDGTSSAAANGNSGRATLDIGRNGGRGVVTVSGGGQIQLFGDSGTAGGMTLNLGRDANSAGTLNISGGGSVVRLESVSSVAGGGAGETLNPAVRIGREGSGILNISAGGKLLLDGGAVSTQAARRSTNIYIGGASETANGGTGLATITGAGSEIRVSGGDTFIGVGLGPQSNGTLVVTDHASISGMSMSVGRSGGVGVLRMDQATLTLSGQQTAGNVSGGFLGIGSGGSIGVATLDHGSSVTLSNPGSAGAHMILGGNGTFPGGQGSLTLAGGSQIVVQAAPGLGSAQIGYDGSGFMRMQGGSTLDLSGGALFVGRKSGGDGTLIVSDSTVTGVGWMGVGRDRVNGVESDGGTGTVVLINSTLSAQNIVIGGKGFLCGTGTITGNVTNHGIFCPGNSPGTVHLNGDYASAAGGKIVLEVQGSSAAGFATDAVFFGGAVDLANAQIEFRFLGDTNPNEFLAGGTFDIDSFLGRDNGAGGLAPLGDASFAGVQFSAAADAYVFTEFTYSADGGATFTAVPVPEPGSALLWLGGLSALAFTVRRRRAGAP